MKQYLPIFLLGSLGLVYTQDANATTVPVLTLTEVSSTELDYSWSTGEHGVVTSAGGDSWMTSTMFSGPTLGAFDFTVSSAVWAEPGNPNESNFASITFTPGMSSPWSLDVASEASGAGFNNGDTISSEFGSFQVKFFDNGDSSSVPDSGSTLLLLTLGLVGVGLLQVKSKARTFPVCG